MTSQLWLKFKNENGELQKIAVDKEVFFIGRSSENELVFRDNSLSRKHAKIESFSDVYVVSDCQSINGTTLNGERLETPQVLKNKDVLNLGGSLEIEIELNSSTKFKAFEESFPQIEEIPQTKAETVSEVVNFQPVKEKPKKSDDSAIPFSFFILAPLFGFLILGGLVVSVWLLTNPAEKETVKNDNNFIFSEEPKKTSENNDEKTEEKPSPTTQIIANTQNTSISNSPTPEIKTTQTPQELPVNSPISSDLDKLERNAYSFMRQIAQNDPNPVLTSKQLKLLNDKKNQMKSSATLRENFRNLKKNSAQIINIARSKNLKPQFLAIAALAKLNNERGDVGSSAQSMAEVLDNLSIQIGNALADDNLLVIAAYEQGVAGENLKMRDLLASLTKNSPNSSRQIRTIWFLHENGKISDSQFELALRFLTIGTLFQNPKDFGIGEEPLTLN